MMACAEEIKRQSGRLVLGDRVHGSGVGDKESTRGMFRGLSCLCRTQKVRRVGLREGGWAVEGEKVDC